jgi:hypothetical protein
VSSSLGNPQTPQGFLNRIRGHMLVPNYPQLNVTASFLGEGGFDLSWGTPTTTMINTMTGRVVSPEPYQVASVGIHLVKSMTLAAAWEQQRSVLSNIGNVLLFTDSAPLGAYTLTACAIENVGQIVINGKSAEYLVTITGTFIVNNALFALAV